MARAPSSHVRPDHRHIRLCAQLGTSKASGFDPMVLSATALDAPGTSKRQFARLCVRFCVSIWSFVLRKAG
jgi:hypothetical protein